MGRYKNYTPDQREIIEVYAEMGYTDDQIVKKTCYSIFVVRHVTNKYWHKKMRKAYDWYNY